MSDTTDNAASPEQGIPVPTAAAQPTPFASSTHHINEVTRDCVADRTGELLDAAIEVARESQRVKVVDATDPRDGTQALIVIRGDTAHALDPNTFDKYRLTPIDRHGTAQLTRLDSFIDLTNRYKAENSAVFADDSAGRPSATDPLGQRGPSLTAVFDYHPSNEMVGGQEVPAALNCKHRATYAFPMSNEWRAWAGRDGKVMSMTDFARFLEDHIVDVVADAAPTTDGAKAFVAATNGKMASPSALMEISRGLQVFEKSVVKEVRNLTSGEAEIKFESEHQDASGSKLTIPNVFMICIPIFARSPDAYQLLARLRYRKTPDGLVFSYELWRADLAFEDAFTGACNEVAEKTGLPIYTGSPEA